MAAACVMGPGRGVSAADIVVAPEGDDANPGTADRPFQTIIRAQQVARDRIAQGLDADLRVVIRAGRYELTEPLRFGPADGGSERFGVTYAAAKDQKVVISGGRRITGWTRGHDGVWTAKVPAGWAFRQLFVDGRRAIRARTPNAETEKRYWRLLGGELTKDLKRHTVTLKPEQLAKIPAADGLEIVVLKNWATLHKRIEGIDRATGVVTLAPPHVKYFSGNRPRKGCACFLENARVLLDAPGEWFLDTQAATLHYRPREGEDMTRADVIAPRLERLVAVTGTEDAPVRNLHFRGLSFEHAGLPLPPEGHHGRQAAFRYGGDNFTGRMPSAIEWRAVTHSSMVGCRIAHIGSGGVDLYDRCHRNRIEGCEVWDVAGNGIGLGGRNDPARVPTKNRIANNVVHHCGAVYYGACGIWVGFAQETTVAHNLVCHLPYTGISFGWQWNANPTVAREYLIDRNRVFDVMNEVSDGGALYSLGFQPGTVVSYNLLYEVHRSDFAHAAPNNGIFFDQGSKAFRIVGNVIHSTSGKPVRFNQCKREDHTWADNHIGIEPAKAKGTRAYKEAGLEAAWRHLVLRR